MASAIVAQTRGNNRQLLVSFKPHFSEPVALDGSSHQPTLDVKVHAITSSIPGRRGRDRRRNLGHRHIAGSSGCVEDPKSVPGEWILRDASLSTATSLWQSHGGREGKGSANHKLLGNVADQLVR